MAVVVVSTALACSRCVGVVVMLPPGMWRHGTRRLGCTTSAVATEMKRTTSQVACVCVGCGAAFCPLVCWHAGT